MRAVADAHEPRCRRTPARRGKRGASRPAGPGTDPGRTDRCSRPAAVWALPRTDPGGRLPRPADRHGDVRLTRGQLAVWYAGGYRTAAASHLAGITARSQDTLTRLIRTTMDVEPWLPDHI
ncbi:sterol carrier protein domain-containing protein [Streptomyces sp. BRA346]